VTCVIRESSTARGLDSALDRELPPATDRHPDGNRLTGAGIVKAARCLLADASR